LEDDVALTSDLVTYQTITAPSGSSAALVTQPFENTHTIILRNVDPTNSVLVGVILASASLTADQSTLGPGDAITLRIGTAEWRPAGDMQVANAAQQVVKVQGIGGTADVNAQFLNSSKSVAP
jgi:hypothetical protein